MLGFEPHGHDRVCVPLVLGPHLTPGQLEREGALPDLLPHRSDRRRALVLRLLSTHLLGVAVRVRVRLGVRVRVRVGVRVRVRIWVRVRVRARVTLTLTSAHL